MSAFISSPIWRHHPSSRNPTTSHHRSVHPTTATATPRNLNYDGRGPSETRNEKLYHPSPTSTSKSLEIADRLLSQNILKQEHKDWMASMSPSRAERIEQALNGRTNHVTIVLDRIDTVNNVAAILRTCEAFGLQGIFLVFNPGRKPHDEDPDQDGSVSSMKRRNSNNTRQVPVDLAHALSFATSKISKNAQKWLSIYEYKTAPPCYEELKKQGYTVLVSSLAPDATPLQEIDYSKSKVALVFGNEHEGVGEYFRDNADGRFTIPMQGLVESCNVSVAVAVAAHNAYFRAKQVVPPSQFGLSVQAKSTLLLNWLTESSRRVVDSKQNGRFQSISKQPRSFGVTNIGVDYEHEILEQGVMIHPVTRTASISISESGARLFRYLQKHRAGAISDSPYTKRCNSISRAIAGTEALLAVASIRKAISEHPPNENDNDSQSDPLSLFDEITPKTIMEHLVTVMNGINQEFEPLFDVSGVPIAVHSEHTKLAFDNVGQRFPDYARNAFIDLISNYWNVSARYLPPRAELLEYIVGYEEKDLGVIANRLLGLNSPLSSVMKRQELLLELGIRFIHAACCLTEFHMACFERAQTGVTRRLSNNRNAPFDIAVINIYNQALQTDQDCQKAQSICVEEMQRLLSYLARRLD